MNEMSVERTIAQYLKNLGDKEQQEVLEFARTLSQSKRKGTLAQSLLSFAGTIDRKDADLMQQAIDHDCERIASREREARLIGGAQTDGSSYFLC